MLITRYLTREVLNTLLAITLVLTLALLSQQVVRYLNYVAVGKIPTHVLLQLVSFEIPYLLTFLLPLGLYLGILIAFGRLYAENEMAILHMYGYGAHRVLKLTVYIAIGIGLIVLFLMLWVNPVLSAKRQQIMASDEAAVHLVETMIPGRFQVSPDGRHVMYVETLSVDRQRAENVFLAQEKKNPEDAERSSWMLVSASQGYQMQDPDSHDQFFVTTDGYRYDGTPGQNDFKIIQFKQYGVRIPSPDSTVIHQEDETLSTFQLWNDYANPKRAAEFQWRFSMAIATVMLALLAVPLSAVRPRTGRFITLLPAILIYIIYVNLLLIARHWVERRVLPPSLGVWWVHAIVLLFVLLVLFSRRTGKA